MPQISLLSEDLINKIAAGEVIERPASVVKELIENSLDAGATIINIEIKDSGKELIKVSDNGKGMDEEDAKNSILRHATSKIKNVDDLFAIQTLGFRGEALASIAAVSRLSITTKQKEKVEGFSLAVYGGNIVSSGIVGADQGTIIEVHNLFFNTPARKKFLKTDAVELRHIVDVVLRYALINNDVSFKLVHEGHQLLSSPAVENFRSNIASVYGINLARELLEVDYQDDSVRISGFVCKPHQARNDRTQQQVFVNNRWVKSDEITKGVYDSYHSLLFVGKHPVFVLNVEIDPEKIDINVHPSKTEIKIEQKKEVYDTVLKAVKATLEKNNLIPVTDFDYEQQLTFGTAKEEVKKNEIKYPFEQSDQTVLNEKGRETVTPASNFEGSFERSSHVTPEEEVFVPEKEKNEKAANNVKLPPMKILGQVHKTFFVAETEGGTLFIDQHVVQERVLYEKFMEQLMNKKVAVQELLKGEVLEFTPSEKISLLENKEKLIELGFKLEEFGENSFILRTVPTLFGRLQPKELVFEVLDKLKEGKNKLEEVQEEIITRMACRASVKAGDELSIPQMQKLLDELSKAKLPYTCPHGRAVLIKVNVDELEKKFRRK